MTAERTRRAYLALLAAGVGGAGCTSLTGSETPTETPADVPTATASASPPDVRTDDPGRVVLEPTGPPADATLTVFPTDLATWLREAATGETVRAVASTPRYTPEPYLRKFDRIDLRTPDVELGTFAVDAEGGTHYELLVGAVEVESVPGDATVTPVQELPPEHRRLARDVIDGLRRTVEPQTELGEWVRHGWFDGYFRHDGTVYRGMEVHQTDAAFFSERLWLVLRLSDTEESNADPVRLELPSLNRLTREVLRDAVVQVIGEDGSRDRGVVPTNALPEEGRRFVHETGYLLTHTAVLSVSVVPPS